MSLDSDFKHVIFVTVGTVISVFGILALAAGMQPKKEPVKAVVIAPIPTISVVKPIPKVITDADIRKAADRTVISYQGVNLTDQYIIFRTFLNDRVENETIHFVIRDNNGGNPEYYEALNKLKKPRNLVYTAEARGMVASAGFDQLINTTRFIVYKDSTEFIHSGASSVDGGVTWIPQVLPARQPKEGGVFEQILTGLVGVDPNLGENQFVLRGARHLNNSKYLTGEQWQVFLTGKEIELKGDEFCAQNKDKIITDTATYCILKGLDYKETK